MTSRRNTGVKLGDEGREVEVWLRIAEQQDYAEKVLIDVGIGESAARKLIEKFPHITRKHANKLLRFVQMRWERERVLTTRQARKNLVRKRGEQLYRLALERKRAVVVNTGDGLSQEVKEVADPDFRAADSVLGKLIDLDALRGEIIDDLQKTPEGAKQAARQAFAEAYGVRALPAENDTKE